MNSNKYLKGEDKYELMLTYGAAWLTEENALKTKKYAKTAEDKEMAKYLKLASSYLYKAFNLKLSLLEEEPRQEMEERKDYTILKVVPYDAVRVQQAMRMRSLVSLPTQDLMNVAELAMIGCHNCPQGEFVKKCIYRKSLHACGIPISPKEAEGPGRCEFRSGSGIQIILPHGHDKHIEHVKKSLERVINNDERKKSDEVEERVFF